MELRRKDFSSLHTRVILLGTTTCRCLKLAVVILSLWNVPGFSGESQFKFNRNDFIYIFVPRPAFCFSSSSLYLYLLISHPFYLSMPHTIRLHVSNNKISAMLPSLPHYQTDRKTLNSSDWKLAFRLMTCNVNRVAEVEGQLNLPNLVPHAVLFHKTTFHVKECNNSKRRSEIKLNPTFLRPYYKL